MPVGTEGGREDGALVLKECADGLSGGGVEDARGRVVGGDVSRMSKHYGVTQDLSSHPRLCVCEPQDVIRSVSEPRPYPRYRIFDSAMQIRAGSAARSDAPCVAACTALGGPL